MKEIHELENHELETLIAILLNKRQSEVKVISDIEFEDTLYHEMNGIITYIPSQIRFKIETSYLRFLECNQAKWNVRINSEFDIKIWHVDVPFVLEIQNIKEYINTIQGYLE
jgi:hypothetical protein